MIRKFNLRINNNTKEYPVEITRFPSPKNVAKEIYDDKGDIVFKYPFVSEYHPFIITGDRRNEIKNDIQATYSPKGTTLHFESDDGDILKLFESFVLVTSNNIEVRIWFQSLLYKGKI